ncbi:MAG: hypothetical protein ACJAVI_001547 [Candidatus Azotimanducaceae bacterium]|jgi:hypothetical protein
MPRNNIHEEVIELLPWLVNESLSANEQLRVTNHLKTCEICRDERDNLQRLQVVVAEDDGVKPNFRFAFRKLEARIDVAEANRSSVEGIPLAEGYSLNKVSDIGRRSWFSSLGVVASLIIGYLLGSGAVNLDSVPVSLSARNLASTTSDIATSDIATSNIATSEIVALNDLAPSNFTQDSVINVDRFVTLTSGNADDATGVVHRVYLTFSQSARAETIRAALIETRAQIVSGPDLFGTYTVNMSVPVEQTDANFITSIRQKNGVKYADFKEVSDLHSNR